MNSFMSWVGGKKSLRDAVLARFPPYYERYIEVFGGAGWILFHKPPGNDFEVYNDFNSNLVNLYRCVRDNPNKLKYKLRYVLDSRQDFEWIGRPLMTVDELKSMPKGQFIVMKTGTHPMISKLKLYFKWGIQFEKPYLLPDKVARAVRYLERDELMREIAVKYPQKKKVLPPPEAEVEIVNEYEPHPHGEKVKFNVKTGG